MKDSIIFFPFALVLGLLTLLLFVVRLAVWPFSAKIAAQMQKHRMIHLIWGGFAFASFFVIFIVLNPLVWPPDFVKRREQRQKLSERVQKAGGWDAVRLGCEALSTNYPDGFFWVPFSFMPANVAQADQLTASNLVGDTNFVWKILPPAVAALQPREIRYSPRRFSPKDEPEVDVVYIRIFGMPSTGGHATPYFGVEIIWSTNAVDYRPQTSNQGVPGNRHSTYKKVADGIYEIY